MLVTSITATAAPESGQNENSTMPIDRRLGMDLREEWSPSVPMRPTSPETEKIPGMLAWEGMSLGLDTVSLAMVVAENAAQAKREAQSQTTKSDSSSQNGSQYRTIVQSKKTTGR
uniref:Uncharacterized protein n=1 Tax=Grammatophora oceanica TaxID=210454 RepID=A0A7S1V7I3_9STRA|mmetsp:Transcript_37172/g.55381  ORF Transcript_37172/g.55381 Transcript_37172/m.55381 type:complete len:115 (+) Transcript_37172:653-997(+)